MKQVNLDNFAEMLRLALPDYCKVRSAQGGEIIANRCFGDYLALRGVFRSSPAAKALIALIATGGDWKIPNDIHDRVCGCQNEGPLSLKQAMERVSALISGWQIPSKKPETKDDVVYFAGAGGTKESPVLYIWFVSTYKTGVAAWILNEERWALSLNGGCLFFEVIGLEDVVSTMIRLVR